MSSTSGRWIKKHEDSSCTSALPTSSTRDVPARAAWLKPPPRCHTPHAHRVGRHGRRVGLLAHFGRPWGLQRFHNVGEVEADDTTGRAQRRDSSLACPADQGPRSESESFTELPCGQQVLHRITFFVRGRAGMVLSPCPGPSPHSLCSVGILGHSISILPHLPWAYTIHVITPVRVPSSRGHRPQAGKRVTDRGWCNRPGYASRRG